MISYTFLVLFYFSILSAVGLLLILLRDDRDKVLLDLKKGFGLSFFTSVLHFFLIFSILPLTIPFSVTRILNKYL